MYPLPYGNFYAHAEAFHEATEVEIAPLPTHVTVSRTLLFDTSASLMYPTYKSHAEPGQRRGSEGQEHIDITFVHYEDYAYLESRVLRRKVYLVEATSRYTVETGV